MEGADHPTFVGTPNVPVSQNPHPLVRPPIPGRKNVHFTMQAPSFKLQLISCPNICLYPGCRMINIPPPLASLGNLPRNVVSFSGPR